MKHFVVNTEDDLDGVIDHIVELTVSHPICLLYGDLGAGKTTTVKHLAKRLGSTDEVSSPSFSLINEYASDGGVIYHMDMYRLESLEEALDIGIEEYLDSGQICLIEWPQLIEELIVENFIKISIKVEDKNSRTITVE